MSDFDYKEAFGYDFAGMTPEQKSVADAWLPVFAKASASEAYPGAAEAKKFLETRIPGGPSAELARRMSAYAAYKAQLAPMGKDELAAAKISQTPEQHAEYTKKWVDDHASQFAGLVHVNPDKAVKSDKEERAIEMQPIEVKAKPPVAAPLPAAGDAPAPAAEPAPAPIVAPAPAVAAPQPQSNVPPTPIGPNNWTRQQLNPATGQYEEYQGA